MKKMHLLRLALLLIVASMALLACGNLGDQTIPSPEWTGFGGHSIITFQGEVRITQAFSEIGGYETPHAIEFTVNSDASLNTRTNAIVYDTDGNIVNEGDPLTAGKVYRLILGNNQCLEIDARMGAIIAYTAYRKVR